MYANSVTIALAANVSYAMNDLKKEFNKLYPNIRLNIIVGGSGKLATQIKNNAPFDIFMSANMQYPNKLYKDKIAIAKPKVYAKGALVILSKKKYNFKDKIRILQDKNIKKIAIANPKTAPYGKATYEALKNANLYNKVKNKFIFTESISQTVSYIFIGADIGFVAKSSLYSKKLKKLEQNINWIDVDANLYSPIKQGIVILDNAKDNQYAKYFYKFILSNKARIIFKKYGYILP